MSPYRVGIVGCGLLGTTHAETIARVPELSATVFCDTNLARAQALQDGYGGRATSDVSSILADDQVDAVYIASRHDSHADLCVDALRADKHVLVEKPLALTEAECTRIADAAARSRGVLMVGFKMRFYDMVLKARELVPEPQLVSMQMMDDPWPADGWVNDPVAGGGNVLSQGCHSCDLLRFVTRRDPVQVYAAGGNYYQPTGVIDNLAATFRFEDGIAASWIQGDAGRPPQLGKFFLQMYSEGRSVTLSDRLTKLTYQRAGGEEEVLHGSESGLHQENLAFVQAMREGVSPIGVEDGLYATLMPLQAIRSLSSGRPEPVRDAMPLTMAGDQGSNGATA
jgi:predicted dehydrogenase